MAAAPSLVQCAACGRSVPRDDMFGAEPDLICERCAEGIRKRMAPRPTGRLVSAFAGRPTPVTALVLGLSAVLFVCTHLIFTTDQRPLPGVIELLLPWSSRAHNIWTGEWWRLITSALIHGGWLHVIFNSMWVWSLGRAVEGTRGSWRFLLIFASSAAFASAAEAFFGRGVGIGLSGVLYALAGYLWMRRKEDPVAATVLNPQTAQILGIWFLACIFIIPNIANWAHGGGLAWGLFAGWLSTRHGPVRWAGLGVLALVTIAAVAVVTTGHRLAW